MRALITRLAMNKLTPPNIDDGAAWAMEALEHSDQWLFGAVNAVFGRPPGGPLTLALAALNFGTVLARLVSLTSPSDSR